MKRSCIRRFLSTAGALALTCSIAACGSSAEPAPQTEAGGSAAQTQEVSEPTEQREETTPAEPEPEEAPAEVPEAKQETEAGKAAESETELEENEYDGGPDFTSRADELYDLSDSMYIEDILEKYSIAFVDGGKHADYEGDIGDIIPAYKNVDLDGDHKSDVIKREGHHYVVEFSDGNTLKTSDYSSSPNECEVIEFADLGYRNVDEILITHYTCGTAGPTVWDTAVFSNAGGSWQSYPVVDKDGVIRSKDLQDYIAERTGQSYEAGSVRVAGAELSGGVHLLLDFGTKDGPDQVFDYEGAHLNMYFHPDHIAEYDDYFSYGSTRLDTINMWPLEACGPSVEITPEVQYKYNIFLSNFSEQGFPDYRWDPCLLAHFCLEWAKLNDPSRVKIEDDSYMINYERENGINTILPKYFNTNFEESDFWQAGQDNPYGGLVFYEKDGNTSTGYYSEPAADGEMYKYNAFTVVTDLQDLGADRYSGGFVRAAYTVYRMDEEAYDLDGIGKAQYSLSAAEAEKLAEKGELFEAYRGFAVITGWNGTSDPGDPYLYVYRRFDEYL